MRSPRRRQGRGRNSLDRDPDGNPGHRGDSPDSRQAFEERGVRQLERGPQAQPEVQGDGLEAAARAWRLRESGNAGHLKKTKKTKEMFEMKEENERNVC